MRVVLVHGMSGTRDGVEWPPLGSVIDLPADEAAGYLAVGIVREATAEDGKVETAMAPAPAETATAKRQKG